MEDSSHDDGDDNHDLILDIVRARAGQEVEKAKEKKDGATTTTNGGKSEGEGERDEKEDLLTPRLGLLADEMEDDAK